MTASTATRVEFAHLRASTPQTLPFGPNLEARAYLLERDAGNLLIYSNGTLADDVDWLARAGVERQYLNHWHESLFGLAPRELRARLLVHRADAPEVIERGGRPLTFDRDHRLGDDFEAIPIPGHTPGATAYLWDSGERRFLFTGDSVYLHRGRWRAGLLDSSDPRSFVKSLKRLRDVDFDVMVPWVTSVGEPWAVPLSVEERHERFDRLIDWVRQAR